MVAQKKKYPCGDCQHCQWCSDDRCRLCRKTNCVRKLSIAEQIEVYEQLNHPDARTNATLEAQNSE